MWVVSFSEPVPWAALRDWGSLAHHSPAVLGVGLWSLDRKGLGVDPVVGPSGFGSSWFSSFTCERGRCGIVDFDVGCGHSLLFDEAEREGIFWKRSDGFPRACRDADSDLDFITICRKELP